MKKLLIIIFVLFNIPFILLSETLEECLIKNKIDISVTKSTNIKKNITSYSVTNDSNYFIIAYYLDNNTGMLGDNLYIELFDKSKKEGKKTVLNLKKLIKKYSFLFGSIVHIEYNKSYIFLQAHYNPSAGGTLIITKDLTYKNKIYGNARGYINENLIVYDKNQTHFAPTHYSEISILNFNNNEDYQIYPMKPYQSIRLNHIKTVKEAYDKLGKDWFRINRHHMNPELFNNGLSGKVIVNDETGSLAFLINYYNYDCRQKIKIYENEGEYIKVLYIYKNVHSKQNIKYKEYFYNEIMKEYKINDISKLLEPDLLAEIFK